MERTIKNQSLVTRIEHTQRVRQIDNFILKECTSTKLANANTASLKESEKMKVD